MIAKSLKVLHKYQKGKFSTILKRKSQLKE